RPKPSFSKRAATSVTSWTEMASRDGRSPWGRPRRIGSKSPKGLRKGRKWPCCRRLRWLLAEKGTHPRPIRAILRFGAGTMDLRNGLVGEGSRRVPRAASIGPQPPKLRVVLYSHDTMGLGHMRRNLLIAQTLIGSRAAPVILMIAGAKEAGALPLPP